ncbi:hypothetical protein L4C38_15595 [Vibrio kasasachensis]|uniref:hypothetical protein n=1 Tax=Vibrio kasasachensis TaxID=2910248 RepID=UPI003D0A7946
MNQEKLVDVYIPALVALLTRAEEIAKRPLSETEVLRIRDKATKVSQPLSGMPAFLKQRGYHDIYAPEAWEEWKLYRDGKLDLSIGDDENT